MSEKRFFLIPESHGKKDKMPSAEERSELTKAVCPSVAVWPACVKLALLLKLVDIAVYAMPPLHKCLRLENYCRYEPILFILLLLSDHFGSLSTFHIPSKERLQKMGECHWEYLNDRRGIIKMVQIVFGFVIGVLLCTKWWIFSKVKESESHHWFLISIFSRRKRRFNAAVEDWSRFINN